MNILRGGVILDRNGSREFMKTCAALAREKKATDILALDISGLTTIADYFLLLTAANNRQATAIADYLLEENEQKPLRMEGYQEGRWILLDYGALIVHIFQEEEREYYNLERLWGDAEKEEL